jgi:hypothetical protein
MHERYLFVVLPALFVWFFSVYKRVPMRTLVNLTAISIAISALVFAVGIGTWLSHPTWADSPSATLFFSLYARLPDPALCVAVFAIFGLSSLVAIVSDRSGTRSLAITIATQLVLLNIGWYEFQLHYIQPIERASRTVSRLIQNTVEPTAPIAFISDNLDPQVVWSFGYWTRNPIRVYGLVAPTPWAGEAGRAKINGQRAVSLDGFSPRYVVANTDLPLPLVEDYAQYHVKIYKYTSDSPGTN